MNAIPTDDTTLRATIVETLRRIAPEVSAQSLQHAVPLRDQVDLDSMDWLNFLVALAERFKVEIPESDYRRLVTLDEVAAYLAARST